MAEFRIGSLCSGYGGLDLAVMDVLDTSVAWHAQYDPDDRHQYAAQILAHHWPAVPNHGDITSIDWAAMEPVDILTAGFPCQDLSLAGKRAGMREGNRSGLWFHVARAIEILRPRLVVIENVPGILTSAADGDLESCPWCLGDAGGEPPLRALGAVLADLARLGFDAEWTSLGAADVGAPHRRRRVFLIAWPAADAAHFGHERPRPTRLRRPGSADGRLAAPDAAGLGRGERRAEPARELGGSGAPKRGRPAPADATGLGYGHARQAGLGGVPASPVGGRAATATNPGRVEPERRGRPGELGGPAAAEPRQEDERERAGDTAVDRGPQAPDWGPYAPAIARWERVMMRPAPAPTEPGRTGERLSPAFVEWMMGAPAGHITGVPGIPRTAQLKAAGNGVVVQQGAAALRLLLDRREADRG